MDNRPKLSHCFIQNFLDAQVADDFQPIVQLLEVSKMGAWMGYQQQGQMCARLNDGVFSYRAIIPQELAKRFQQDGLDRRNGVIQITKWKQINSGEKTSLYLMDYLLLSVDFPVIGNPQPHSGKPEDYRGFNLNPIASQNPRVTIGQSILKEEEPENTLGWSPGGPTKRGRASSPSSDIRQPLRKRRAVAKLGVTAIEDEAEEKEGKPQRAHAISETTTTAKNQQQKKRKKKKGLYRCGQCGGQFTRNFDLHRHTLIHSGEKPFQCTECRKRFNRSGILSMHMRHCHPVAKLISEQHICRKCGKEYRHQSSLCRHIRKVHKKKSEERRRQKKKEKSKKRRRERERRVADEDIAGLKRQLAETEKKQQLDEQQRHSRTPPTSPSSSTTPTHRLRSLVSGLFNKAKSSSSSKVEKSAVHAALNAELPKDDDCDGEDEF